MTDEELKKLYMDNPKFQTYVDACRQYDDRTLEEELRLKTVQGVADFYKEQK